MLTQIEAICNTLDYSFIYGEPEAFRKQVDQVTQYPICYHESYGKGQLSLDQQGDIDISYTFSIWLLLPTTGADDRPEQHRARFDELFPVALRLLRELSDDFQLSSMSFELSPVQSAADRWLNGILLQGTAKQLYLNQSICS